MLSGRFNDLFTGQLLKGALDCLACMAPKKHIEVVWVPGAYEQPIALKRLAQAGKHNALVALGAVIQGATAHAGLINAQVARATQISLESGIPVIDGIVAADSLDQAIERAAAPSPATAAGSRPRPPSKWLRCFSSCPEAPAESRIPARKEPRGAAAMRPANGPCSSSSNPNSTGMSPSTRGSACSGSI